jgi:thioredoxin-like negative regulator of GroEL
LSGGEIVFATIQIDSPNADEQLFKNQKVIEMILHTPVAGVPMIVKFHQGLPVDVYKGAHEYDAFKQWVGN